MARTMAIWFLAVGLVLAGSAIAQATFIGNLINYDGVTWNRVVGVGRAGFFDPSTWTQRSDLGAAVVGDLFLAVFYAEEIYWGSTLKGRISGSPPLFSGEWTKVLAMKLTGRSPAGGNKENWTFSAWDSSLPAIEGQTPNINTALNEVLRVWLDDTRDLYTLENDLGPDIRDAQDGVLWASFKLNTLSAEYDYVSVGGIIFQWLVVSMGLDAVSAPGLDFPDTPDFSMSFRVTDLSGSDWKLQIGAGTFPDVQKFRVTPEPATLASLFGIGAVGGLGWIFRRQKFS
ncbi:MAG: PEP-CTERM sorting domain-containing protein [Thermoguttaceae bacterium]|nr:PEP-CTERM sorting domain-containing protein [Thermoguttaceae bacterium]